MSIALEHATTWDEAHEAQRRQSPRRRLQARARGAVVCGLALFGVLQIAAAVLVEGRPELRDPVFEIKFRRLTRLLGQHGQTPATVVFLGSSMSANGMKADMVDAPLTEALGRPAVGFNMSANGAGPVTQLVFLQRMLRRGLRPDLVVVELSPLFSDAGQARFDIRRWPAEILEHADLDTLERHGAPRNLRHAWWQTHVVATYGHRLAILNQSVTVVVPFDDRVDLWTDADAHGWRPRPPAQPEEYGQMMQAIREHCTPRLAKYKMDDAPLKALRELTDLLAAERIAAVLVIMPDGPLLRSLYAPGSDAPLLREFSAMSKKHGMPLVNARDWFGEESFRDSYHLHDQAAVPFTARLVRDAIVPAMTRTEAPH